MKIGFIGLGIMGKPMVRNLLKAGFAVIAYSRTRTDVDLVAADGAVPANSIAEVADCPVIITMLPNGPDVHQVVLGAGGVLENAKEGAVIIDMSSIAPGVAQEIHAKCAEKGVKMLDAPVSGGEPKAIDGTLAIMVGGCPNVFEQMNNVFMAMGASAVLCGEIGAGNITKLANNMIVALNIAAVSEALTLATRAGVDPTKVVDAIKGGLAGSTVLNAKAPMMIENNFKPGFKIDLHIKDLVNAMETGKEIGSPMPMTQDVLNVMQALSADGEGQSDHSAIYKHYVKLSQE